MSAFAPSAPVPLHAGHVLEEFACGEPTLDEWLKRRALRNQASGASRPFVITEGQAVIGYYCLSAGALNHSAAPKAMRRNMPDPLPVVLLGRLAIDERFHNKGLGQALLRDAMLRTLHVSSETGIFAVLVHAFSEAAKRFYLSRGFVESPLQPMTLMMTLETMRAILAETGE
ncbi:MAG: GNAT family N-acetyltransferase [Acidobacteria bacterium]|nr:GNAT family N-acetyltransferase [Acidobacteriota bacterium]